MCLFMSRITGSQCQLVKVTENTTVSEGTFQISKILMLFEQNGKI